ncbi:MAG: SMC-Scp complex subunit ScpB, partial [Oscillospiraceae bacterium]|nr:SMC-Scp complex subunit ScpB [Oscillospiraceae bacterium]
RAQIDQIRGVDSSYTVATLTERGLIETCGRLDSAPGRPMLYRTTDLFLRSTGFNSIDELKAYIPSEQMSID